MARVPGGWKSINYSIKVAGKVGLANSIKSMTSKNTCKVCAYGMGGQRGGMTNEAGEGLEICKKSIQAQLTDIQPAIPNAVFEEQTIEQLRLLSPRELEQLGRLNTPLIKKPGHQHYAPITWNEVIDKIATRLSATPANRTFFYASGRSSNEAAFVLHLFARLYGTNNVNNCSYYCHQASGVGMGSMLGTGTATIQLEDLKKSDLIFVIGANPSSNHPRFLTELMHCRRRGGQVVIINPALEPGLVKFTIPSSVASMLKGGSDLASVYLQPHIGGDIAVLIGIAKGILERGGEDHQYIEQYTERFSDFKKQVDSIEWAEIERSGGITRSELESVAQLYSKSNHVVFTWAMGITHHVHGVENVESIVNLALLRGMVGKKYAGLLPLRGHSNVQGIGSVGVSPQLKAQIFENIESQLGIQLPTTEGWDTMKCMKQALLGNVDAAFMLGGNLYGSNPDTAHAEEALNNIPFKVYMNTTLNPGHLYGVEGETIILPVVARDEEQQVTTQESMFNFVRLSDGGIKRMSQAKSEVEILVEIAKRVLKDNAFDIGQFQNYDNIRKAIAKTIPGFQQIETIQETKEEFQISGRTLHQPSFNTSSQRAQFRAIQIPSFAENDSTHFRLMSVRSEGQFNSIIYDEDDPWRGQTERWVILMNPEDIDNLGLKENDLVTLESRTGRMEKVKVRSFNIKKGNIMGYYPETNVLVSTETDPRSLTPGFKNTLVKVVTN